MPPLLASPKIPHFVVTGNCGESYGVQKSLYTPGQRKIAQAVVAMRHDAGLTQRQLAAKLRRPLNVLSRIEAGQRRVDLLEWVALCEACGVAPAKAGGKLLAELAGE